MVGIYFSGTGNTKYCIEQFVKSVDYSAACIAIEDKNAIAEIQQNDTIILAYPVYYSNIPKIMRDFLIKNSVVFKDKRIFIIATMGLFSGDGAGCSARLLAKYGADIIGGLHLKMPDCIGDEKVLKKTLEQNKQIVKAAKIKLEDTAQQFKNNNYPKEGLLPIHHIAGLFGQRLWFYNKTKKYSDKLKINYDKCVGCAECVKLCSLENLKIKDKKALTNGRCTLCYRCISNCPKQAITLLGNKLYEQCKIEKYL